VHFGHLPGRSSVSTGVLIALAVAVGTALPALFVVLRNWLIGRRLYGGRTVRLEIDGHTFELRGASDEAQAKLIDAWLSHVSDKEGEESGDR
jgi:hypothetical protein